jgi:hypothetical protein
MQAALGAERYVSGGMLISLGVATAFAGSSTKEYSHCSRDCLLANNQKRE